MLPRTLSSSFLAYTVVISSCLICISACQSPTVDQPHPTTTTTTTTQGVVYVASDGTGDFNCDGSNDEVEINEALNAVAADSSLHTVHLKGPNTYWIDSTILISANTTLQGDPDARVKLVDHAQWWQQFKALIAQKGAVFQPDLQDPNVQTTNITIRGFEIDGNRDQQEEPPGDSYYTAISLQNTNNITISDMYIHDNLNDAVRVSSNTPTPIESTFFNNRIHNHGHDGFYLINSENFEVFNNNITNSRTNSGVRAQDCNHFKVYGNIIGNDPDRPFSGGAAVQVEADNTTAVNDVEISHNYLYGNQYWHGIWLHQEQAGGTLQTHRDVFIHHNVISWYRLSGIGIYGFHNTLIENNVIELSAEGAGVSFEPWEGNNTVSGFTTVVRNNIIVNNNTFAVDDQLPEVHTFLSSYNCTDNNASGAYSDTPSTTDTSSAPLFAHGPSTYYTNYKNGTYNLLSSTWADAQRSSDFRGDLSAHAAWSQYHLQSEAGRWSNGDWVVDTASSPCIDKGSPDSDYNKEPAENGGRVNIGAFGNTAEASKSL